MIHRPALDDASRRLTIGVDVGGTNVRAARIGPDGQLAGLLKVRTDSMPSVPDVVEALIRRLMSDDVVAVGVGIPGRLDRDRSKVLSAGFVNVAGIPLGEVLSARIGRPVVMDNDAHMALAGELAVGAAKDVDDVVMFTVGTGIGGAVADARRVLRGRGNAGQLGHLTVDPNGPECNCGRRGCAEVFVSGTALSGYIVAAGLSPGTSVETLLDTNGHSPAAAAVLARWVTSWRHAIDTVVAVLDPDLVVLGGGLGVAAVAAIQGAAPASPWFECPVVAAALGDNAGVVGAGLRAFSG
jgi:predicted NBD/HSP70 family sugar kinase